MRLVILGTSALLTLLLTAPAGAPATAAPAARTVGTVSASSSDTALAREVVSLTNRARARRGCPALRMPPSLTEAAGRHSVLMAHHGQLSHRLPGEPNLRSRTAAVGFAGARLVGENVAVGYPSASGVVSAWMRSPTHRAVMLDCRFREVGVGTLVEDGRRWWTMDVGRR